MENNFTPREVGALFESLKDEIGIIAEGQVVLRKDMDDMRVTLGRTLERVTGLDIKFNVLNNSVTDLKKDVTILKTDVTNLKTTTAKILDDTTEIKKTVANHENRITRLETSKA